MQKAGVVKRFLAFVLLVLAIGPFSTAEVRKSVSSNMDIQNCDLVRIFTRIWKSHPLGELESGAWIVMNEQGQFEQVNWMHTPERNRSTWSGILPKNIVAQVHTHGERLDPKPSDPDAQVARRLQIDVYTITRKGIWKVSRDGSISFIIGRGWFKQCLRRCG